MLAHASVRGGFPWTIHGGALRRMATKVSVKDKKNKKRKKKGSLRSPSQKIPESILEQYSRFHVLLLLLILLLTRFGELVSVAVVFIAVK